MSKRGVSHLPPPDHWLALRRSTDEWHNVRTQAQRLLWDLFHGVDGDKVTNGMIDSILESKFLRDANGRAALPVKRKAGSRVHAHHIVDEAGGLLAIHDNLADRWFALVGPNAVAFPTYYNTSGGTRHGRKSKPTISCRRRAQAARQAFLEELRADNPDITVAQATNRADAHEEAVFTRCIKETREKGFVTRTEIIAYLEEHGFKPKD